MLDSRRFVLAVGPCFRTTEDRERARRALREEGMTLVQADSQDDAALWLCEADPVVVLIALTLRDGSPLAVADFCNYRRPKTRVILVGGGELVADGSIFGHVGNAAALVPGDLDGPDATALIAFHADHVTGRELVH